MEMIPTGVFFLILLFTFLFYKHFIAKGKNNNSIPINWPVLGMMPGLLLNSRRVHDYATDILEQSGGTFLFKGPWFSKLEMLITSDPANVNYILSQNFRNFQKGPDFKKMFDILGDGIFRAESDSWESQRRIALPIIRETRYEKFVATTSWSKTEACLIPILDLVSETGQEIDMQELFKRFAFDCSCIMVLGHDPASLRHDLPYLPHEKAFAAAEEAILQRHILPETFWKIQQWLQVGKEKKLSEAKEILDQFLYDCISLKSQNFIENVDFDLLSIYKRTIFEKDGVTNKLLKDNMLNFIFAGKDSISAALIWFFWLVATYPEEQKKIRQEILNNLTVDEAGKWNFSSMDELKPLYYLHGALCEALRLFPPIALQHKAPVKHDKLPSGHQINPNTRTILTFYSMGRMESIWGKDCLDFKPGRWISETGGIKSEPSYKFTAFNAGPRSCIGKDVSFVQLKIVAAAIISRFNIQVVEGHPISPSTSAVLHMKHGLKVNVSSYV